jgi:hypothetical protein
VLEGGTRNAFWATSCPFATQATANPLGSPEIDAAEHSITSSARAKNVSGGPRSRLLATASDPF